MCISQTDYQMAAVSLYNLSVKFGEDSEQFKDCLHKMMDGVSFKEFSDLYRAYMKERAI